MAKNNVPIIGITCDYKEKTKKYSLNRAYVEAIRRANGAPIILAPVEDILLRQKQANIIDGLLLTGGRDIEPTVYGEQPILKLKKIHSIRQQHEIELVKLVCELNKPILGICLGCQLLNVALGGTLYQDIKMQLPTASSHLQKNKRKETSHIVYIKEGSKLHQILKVSKLKTNSFHHQAIKKIAPNLRASAYAEDGIIEAIETKKDDCFLLGIQWHPEELIENPLHLALFEALVEEAIKLKIGKKAK